MATNEELIKHWHDSSDENFDIMMYLFTGGKYTFALYVGHLVLEKLFKALYIKVTQDPIPPYIHNLNILAQRCNLEISPDIIEKLGIINSFNTETRYEDIKREIYARCTKEYTTEQIDIIKGAREWLKTELTKE